MELVKDRLTGLHLPRDAGKRLAIPQPHHSISDWNWSSDTWGKPFLNTVIYHSAPSSLEEEFGTGFLVALCKVASTRKLPQGQIAGWWYMPSAGSAHECTFLLRHQTPYDQEPPYQPYDCYIVSWNDAQLLFVRRYDEGDYTDIHYDQNGDTTYDDSANFPQDTWVKRRVTWWSGKDYQNDDAILIRVDRWTGSAWVEIHTWFDKQDQWKTSAVNGCGIKLRSSGKSDDIEIWIP